MHHAQSDIAQRLTGAVVPPIPDAAGRVPAQQPTSYTVTLARGDTAWNPASTSRQLCGPAIVRYTRYPDGGVDAQVESLVGCAHEDP